MKAKELDSGKALQDGWIGLRVMDSTLACATFAFSFWTLATHLSRVAHLPFRTLAWVGPFVLALGIFCGISATRCLRKHATKSDDSAASPVPVGWRSIAIAAVLVTTHWLQLGYSVFWIGCVILLACGFLRDRRNWWAALDEPAPLHRHQRILLLLLMVVCAAVTYLAHRPDVDDAVYLGTAADALAHPELPVLSHDVLYGDTRLPPMLPSYAVETYNLLIALMAFWFGGRPIFWAHAVFPTFLAALVPLAWSRLMRILSPQHWVAATALALVILCLPADFRGLGNFAFVRLFQAKAVFVSLGIPLLFSYAFTFEEPGHSANGCLWPRARSLQWGLRLRQFL